MSRSKKILKFEVWTPQKAGLVQGFSTGFCQGLDLTNKAASLPSLATLAYLAPSWLAISTSTNLVEKARGPFHRILHQWQLTKVTFLILIGYEALLPW